MSRSSIAVVTRMCAEHLKGHRQALGSRRSPPGEESVVKATRTS